MVNVAAGCLLEGRDHQQRTAMHLAAMSGQAAIIQQLVAAGADVNAQNFKGRSPLYSALVHCHANCVHVLLAAGVRPFIGCLEQRGILPCDAAGALLELLRALLSNAAAADIGNKQKEEAWQLASSQGALGVLQKLLVMGVKLESCRQGELALIHLASLAGESGVLNMLIASGEKHIGLCS